MTAAHAERTPDLPVSVTARQFFNLFTAVFLPMFMAAVDQTLLATATPAIAASLGGLRDAPWISVSYLLAAATVVPLYGRLGDQHGRRRMLFVALALFNVGALACTAAQTLPQLIAARILQGLGGGGLMMLSHALIAELVPPIDRARFQAYFSFVFVSASISGPILGGLVVTHVHWRWLFAAYLPLSLFAAWRLSLLPAGAGHPEAAQGRDTPGQLLFALCMVTGLFWLTSVGHRFAWFSTPGIVCASVTAAALFLLVRNERGHATPFLPLDLLRDDAIRHCVVLVTLFAACLFAVIFFLPIYLQLGRAVSAQASGVLLLPFICGQVVSSTVSTRLLVRTGSARSYLVASMSTASAAFLLLGVLAPGPYSLIVLCFLAGLGLGAVMPVTNVMVQSAAGRARLAIGISMLSLARSTGGAVGAALFGALLFALIPQADRASLAGMLSTLDPQDVTDAFHIAYLATAGVAALGAWVATRLPRTRIWG